MHLTYEEHDFCGENAARTARIMRAVADVLDPNSASQPVTIRHVLGDAAVSATAPTVAQALEALHGNSGTVATHVSAAAVGDVPFPESGGDFTPEQLASPIPAGVDSEGYPWDERIHASSRNTVADGTWRKKRGVDDALVASVRAEWDAKLRPAPAAPTEAERLQADHVSTMPPDPASVGFGAVAQVPPPPPAADDWPADILGPRSADMAPFPQFMAWAGKRMGAGELDNARLLAALKEHNVPVLPSLSAPEHVGKIPAIARQLAGS